MKRAAATSAAVVLLCGCSGQADDAAASSAAARSSADAARIQANKDARQEAEDRIDGAYDFCLQQITDQLKAPATAQFSDRTEEQEGHEGDRYLFTGTVDSENGFGALLRSEWACDIQWAGSGYVADVAAVD